MYTADVPEGVEVFHPHLMCSMRAICPRTIPTVALGGFHVLPTEFILETYVGAHRIQGSSPFRPLLLAILLACGDATLVLAWMIRARRYVIASVARPAQAT